MCCNPVLIGYDFKAQILRMPEQLQDDLIAIRTRKECERDFWQSL